MDDYDPETNQKWKLLDGSGNNLGFGEDCAGYFWCFGDPLKAGFQIDLRGTDYVFAEGSTLGVYGWVPAMRTHLEGTIVLETTGTGSVVDMPIAGGQFLFVECGGYCGHCDGTIFVEKQ